MRWHLLLTLALLTGCASPIPAPTAEINAFPEYQRNLAALFPTPPPRKTAREPEKKRHRNARRTLAQHKNFDALFPEGERRRFRLKFSGVTAGEFVTEILPMKNSRGRKLRHFRSLLKTNSVFSLFFSLRNETDVFCEQESMLPVNVLIQSEENKKNQQTRILYDWDRQIAREWVNTLEGNEKLKSRNKQWKTQHPSQSLFSALYFLRTQELELGGPISFPVSHDEKNFDFKAEVLRQEKLAFGNGHRQARVVRADPGFMSIISNGARGEALLWFSADEQKQLLRFEFPLKFGKLIGTWIAD